MVLARSLGTVEVAIMCPASDVEELKSSDAKLRSVWWRRKGKVLRQA